VYTEPEQEPVVVGQSSVPSAVLSLCSATGPDAVGLAPACWGALLSRAVSVSLVESQSPPRVVQPPVPVLVFAAAGAVTPVFGLVTGSPAPRPEV